MTELAPDFVTLFDRNLSIRYVSPAVERVAGYTPGELIGKHASEFVHPDDVGAMEAAHEKVLRTKDVVTVTLRLRRKDGAWTILETRARNYLDVPELGGLLISSRDAAVTPELAETLRRTANEAENLFQNAPCGYHSIDAHGTFTRINDTELIWLKHRRSDLVGRRTFRDLLTADSQPAYDGHCAALGGHGAVDNTEVEVVRKDGTSFAALLRSVGLFDDAGRLHEIRTVSYDITERKRSEQALAKVNRALRVLAESRREIIRAEREVGLLGAVCRILVEQGGYRAAIVHYVQQDPGSTMRITTKAGFTNREYEEAKVTWSADNEYGRGMIGTAVRTGNLQIGRNLLSNPAVAPWRDLLERSGYESAVIVPLKTHAGVFATLLVCAGEPWAFEKEEIALLQELGDDLSFGIGSLLAKKFAEEHEELSGAAGQTGKNILSKLSQREREVLFPVLDGHSSKEIAAVLGISPASVDTYRSRLMFKLDVEDTSSLIRLAIKEGIIEA